MSLLINLFLAPGGSRIVGQLVDNAGGIVPFTGYGPQTSGAIPTYKKNGGSSIALPDPAEVATNGSSCLIYWNFPPGAFLATDVVTISAVANTFGGTPGFAPAITNQAVSNRVDGTLFPAPPATPTVRLGVNLMPPGLAGLPFYSCYIQNNTGIIYQGSDPGPPALNADQLPTFTHSDIYRWDITGAPNSTSDGKQFAAYSDGGTSTIVYSGGAGSLLHANPTAGCTLSFASQHAGGATGNTLKFITALDGSGTLTAPTFSLYLVGGQDVVPSVDTGRASHVGGWTRQTGGGTNGGYNGFFYKNDRLPGSVWTWSFGNLAAGTWNFFASFPPLSTNTQNAVLTVFENGVAVGAVTIDQTITPTQAGISDWNNTGIHYSGSAVGAAVTGGVITVTLHGDTLGDCIADSVQCQLVGETTGSSPFTPITEIHLYDPSVDAANPPEFHPCNDRALAGMLLLRTMQMQRAMGAAFDYADYATPTRAAYGSAGLNVWYLITKMEIYQNLDSYFDASPPAVLCTLSSFRGSPLPLRNGLFAIFPGGVDLPYAAGGGVVNMAFQGARIQHDPARMATNQFAVQSYGNSGTGTVNPISPTGAYLQINYVSIPWPSYFRRVASLPDCDAYINLTLLTTQACVQQVAADYLATVPVGRRCYLEGGNEHWNSAGPGFPDFRYLLNEGRKIGLSGTEYYCQLVAERHAWFHATLQAAGRGNELVRCFGAQEGNPGGTGLVILNYCQANATPIDVLLIADYFQYQPYGISGLSSLQGGLMAAQLADGCEAEAALGGSRDAAFNQYATMIDAFNVATGGHVVLGGYEGGCPWFAAGGGGTIEPKQSINARHHPQARKTAMGHAAQLQGRGFAFTIQYCDTQPPVADFSAFPNSVYGIHLTYASRPGRGDGTDGLHNNLPDIAGVPPGNFSPFSVSTIAGGLRDWNASLGGGSLKPRDPWADGGFQNLSGGIL